MARRKISPALKSKPCITLSTNKEIEMRIRDYLDKFKLGASSSLSEKIIFIIIKHMEEHPIK